MLEDVCVGCCMECVERCTEQRKLEEGDMMGLYVMMSGRGNYVVEHHEKKRVLGSKMLAHYLGRLSEPVQYNSTVQYSTCTVIL